MRAALQNGLQTALARLHRGLEGKRLRPQKSRRAVSQASLKHVELAAPFGLIRGSSRLH